MKATTASSMTMTPPSSRSTRVYVQRNPEAFDLKEVKTGKSNGTYIEITEGLREGDRIVTRGGEKMPRK
jgi:multidrug efflux pump subunit AcrA (membrane-fusion protein)